MSPLAGEAAWRMLRERNRAQYRNRPPQGELTRSPAADASAAARRLLAEDEARRASQLIQARLGQLVACGRCGTSGARPMRLKAPATGIWLAVLLCPSCVSDGRAQGYALAAYRP